MCFRNLEDERLEWTGSCCCSSREQVRRFGSWDLPWRIDRIVRWLPGPEASRSSYLPWSSTCRYAELFARCTVNFSKHIGNLSFTSLRLFGSVFFIETVRFFQEKARETRELNDHLVGPLESCPMTATHTYITKPRRRVVSWIRKWCPSWLRETSCCAPSGRKGRDVSRASVARRLNLPARLPRDL